MHAIEGSSNVPAFLTKLWRLVDDAKTNDLISWTQNGRSFIIQNQAKFSRELLPQYYKHNNMASFVRQLNMYGFHKVVSADSGGLRVERDEMEFAHPHFLRGQENLLENIKRKQQRRLASDGVVFTQIPTSRSVIVEDNKNMNKLLSDVRDMKRDQDSMNSKLHNLKRENEALWREYANMRQKFTKQQQIIEKLIHFLIAMVKSPSKGLVPKRKFSHLALEASDDSSSLSKINTMHQFLQGNPIDVLGQSETNSGGAQIQEVTEDSDSNQDDAVNSSVNAGSDKVSNAKEQVNTTDDGAGSILGLGAEPLEFDMTSPDPISATNVVSPEGTVLMSNPLLDEDPLSPELFNVVDPSAVTQSFKYPASCTDTVTTSVVCSTGDKTGAASDNSAPLSTSSTNTQVHTLTHKGKKKTVSQKNPTEDSSMRIAVPDKSMNNRHELQNHVDEMQTTIDNLQDFLTNANLNVDSSMLHSVFGIDNYLPELDSMTTVSSGNELSIYNPNLLDLANSMEEESEEDPFSFLNDNFASTSTISQTSTSSSPSSSSTSTSTSFTTPASSSTSVSNTSVPSNKSTRPPPPKHLKVTIKKEPGVDSSLETPVVSPVNSTSLFRGKRQAN
ncbi:heat shock factor protein-like isoform X2 [Portunus trituberculatus]|uniref:heat shock factor protein-like isoform X2 n=1 Tax=Portunus trituberculatus TaxID=210409 RepID=UPI001E1CD229|nr:heat shock factor protein-like isoform X2 [Portunus trituberculatus]